MTLRAWTLRQLSWDEAEPASRSVRHAVFVEEQGIAAELEWDGCDASCTHVVVFAQPELPIGTARMFSDGHIGRMAVLRPWRGCGVGGAMLEALVGSARDRALAEVWLTAQTPAIGFYLAHGFTPVRGELLEAGLSHRKMTRKL